MDTTITRSSISKLFVGLGPSLITSLWVIGLQIFLKDVLFIFYICVIVPPEHKWNLMILCVNLSSGLNAVLPIEHSEFNSEFRAFNSPNTIDIKCR